MAGVRSAGSSSCYDRCPPGSASTMSTSAVGRETARPAAAACSCTMSHRQRPLGGKAPDVIAALDAFADRAGRRNRHR